jgi:putative radical SAM enzyme (TIGR03279 family)
MITGLREDSLAQKNGLRRGDRLLTVNSVKPIDLLHYRYLAATEVLYLKYWRPGLGVREVNLVKPEDTDIGLQFVTDCFDGIKNCRNKCLFCFVDQLPEGMRESLHVKDDDYRLSFLHGNFITATNLSEAELERIRKFHLSPLYLSVHATDPWLRAYLLGRRHPAPIMDQITSLAESGIDMHVQIVLCPGLNDGKQLEQTLAELSTCCPQVASIGIVPVGLTRCRTNLPHLRSFTRPECRRLIKKIASYQLACRERWGRALVYLADEFYLMAGWPLPPGRLYDAYPQLANGIGNGRFFLDCFHKLEPYLPGRLPSPRRFLIATGLAGAAVLRPAINRLNLIENLHLDLLPLHNTLFGPRIKVTGLLSGQDLLWGLRDKRGEEVLIPDLLVRDDSDLLLDGMRVSEIADRIGCRIRVLAPTAEALARAILASEWRKKWESQL